MLLVPPFAIGSVPDTCVVRPIFPIEGAVPTPPEISALPVATAANLESAVVVEAYSKSPTAYEDCPVPPLSASNVPESVMTPLAVIGPPDVVNPVLPPDTSIDVTVPEVLGAAKVPSPRKNVVVLFGGVGTAPPTVAVITGRSAPVAIVSAPVVVVLFKMPVASAFVPAL